MRWDLPIQLSSNDSLMGKPTVFLYNLVAYAIISIISVAYTMTCTLPHVRRLVCFIIVRLRFKCFVVVKKSGNS